MIFLAEETVGAEQNPCITFSNIILRFQHYISTSHGTCNYSHGGINDLLTVTGQGNVLSGNACRNQSCLMFKCVENEELGVTLVTPISKQVMRRTAIAFFDDTVFFSNSEIAEVNMKNYLPNTLIIVKKRLEKLNKKMYFTIVGNG